MIENQASVSPFDWSAGSGSPTGRPDARRIREVASQFESLLIAQLLSSMRQADGSGWLGGGEDQAGRTMTEMAEQCVAQAIAASGGLGLAPIVEQGLGRAGGDAAGSSSSDVTRRR